MGDMYECAECGRLDGAEPNHFPGCSRERRPPRGEAARFAWRAYACAVLACSIETSTDDAARLADAMIALELARFGAP